MANKKVSLGCLFWIALVLLVIVVILLNLKPAAEIMEKTGFTKMIENIFKKDDKNRQPAATDEKTGTTPIPGPGPTQGDVKISDPTPAPSIDLPSPTKQDTGKKKITNKDEKPSPTAETGKNIRRARLYYIKSTEDGNLSLSGFIRSISYNDEPLRATIDALLKGPSSQEKVLSFRTMIPEKTRLRNVTVSGNVAFIDFNEEFRFNAYGKEGQKAQVRQVVYTATEFSNIRAVQFMIEGAKIEYLGEEGLYIGQPLSREQSLQL